MRELITILGVPIDHLNTDEALDRMEEFILEGRRTGQGHQVATVNVDFIVQALEDPELQYLLQDVDLATADGMPLVWASRVIGNPLEGRVAGSDFVPLLAERAAQRGYSIFFLGAGPGVAERAAEVLKQRYPDLPVAGIYAPPFQPVHEMGAETLERIKEANPDILLVAFGNPKQEKFIRMFGRELNVPLMIGVGGTLDFIAGVRQRAPIWMQRLGLEWFYRLIQEPSRLWRRYVKDIFIFGTAFGIQWISSHLIFLKNGKSPFDFVRETAGSIPVLKLKGNFSSAEVFRFDSSLGEIRNHATYVLVDMEQVKYVDSTALGALLNLAREARARGGDVCLVSVPENVSQLLRLMYLDSYFITFPDIDHAQAELCCWESGEPARIEGEISAFPVWFRESAWTVIKAPRLLDSTTMETFSCTCSKTIMSNPYLIVDLSGTAYVANSGLVSLMHLSSLAAQRKGELRIVNVQPEISQLIELENFDKVLAVYPDVTTALI